MLTSVCCVFVSMVQFALQEEKRQKGERLHQHQKHENQMRDLQLQCDSNIRELQQLQVELNALTFTLYLFMFIVYVLNYISMELQSIEQNTHNHVIHPSILPSIFLTTLLTLGHRKLIPAVIGWKTGYFLCRLQYNHIKNIYSLKNNNLWHSNSTGFSSFSTYFF